jgi:hypothetical protein
MYRHQVRYVSKRHHRTARYYRMYLSDVPSPGKVRVQRVSLASSRWYSCLLGWDLTACFLELALTGSGYSHTYLLEEQQYSFCRSGLTLLPVPEQVSVPPVSVPEAVSVPLLCTSKLRRASSLLWQRFIEIACNCILLL